MSPTVLRLDGFRVLILLPPREHGPAHVHVVKGEADVVIALAQGDAPQRTLRIDGSIRAADVRKAERIVATHTDVLLREWRRIHG